MGLEILLELNGGQNSQLELTGDVFSLPPQFLSVFFESGVDSLKSRLLFSHVVCQRVQSADVEPEEEAFEVEAEDVVEDVGRGGGRDVPIGCSRGSADRPVQRVQQLDSEVRVDDPVPSRLVDPEQVGVVVVVGGQEIVDLVEDAADVGDEDDQDEEAKEEVVERVEGSAYDVVADSVVENFDFVYFGQVDDFDESVEEGVSRLSDFVNGNEEAEEIVEEFQVDEVEPSEFEDPVLDEEFLFYFGVADDPGQLVVEVEVEVSQEHEEDDGVEDGVEMFVGDQEFVKDDFDGKQDQNQRHHRLHQKVKAQVEFLNSLQSIVEQQPTLPSASLSQLHSQSYSIQIIERQHSCTHQFIQQISLLQQQNHVAFNTQALHALHSHTHSSLSSPSHSSHRPHPRTMNKRPPLRSTRILSAQNRLKIPALPLRVHQQHVTLSLPQAISVEANGFLSNLWVLKGKGFQGKGSEGYCLGWGKGCGKVPAFEDVQQTIGSEGSYSCFDFQVGEEAENIEQSSWLSGEWSTWCYCENWRERSSSSQLCAVPSLRKAKSLVPMEGQSKSFSPASAETSTMWRLTAFLRVSCYCQRRVGSSSRKCLQMWVRISTLQSSGRMFSISARLLFRAYWYSMEHSILKQSSLGTTSPCLLISLLCSSNFQNRSSSSFSSEIMVAGREWILLRQNPKRKPSKQRQRMLQRTSGGAEAEMSPQAQEEAVPTDQQMAQSSCTPKPLSMMPFQADWLIQRREGYSQSWWQRMRSIWQKMQPTQLTRIMRMKSPQKMVQMMQKGVPMMQF